MSSQDDGGYLRNELAAARASMEGACHLTTPDRQGVAPHIKFHPSSIDGLGTMEEKVEKIAFSVGEVAMRANLGRDRIYDAIRNGDLVAKKFGRRTLVTADALRQFLDGLPALRLPPRRTS